MSATLDEGIVAPRKNVCFKNNPPRWVIKQILTQVKNNKKEITGTTTITATMTIVIALMITVL